MATQLDPYKEPSGFLTLAYILAFTSIALLTVGSHKIIYHTLLSQRDRSEIVYMAGRQRMMAQKIALFASNFSRDNTPKDRDLLQNAVFNFETGHNYLTRDIGVDGKEKIRPMSPALYEIYFKPPYDLDRQVHEYIEAARNYMKYQKGDSEDARDKAFHTVMTMGMGPLTDTLDKAVHRYQDETLLEIEWLGQMQLAISIFIISIILLEAGFIFSPLVRHVKEYSRMLLKLALRDSLTGLSNRRAFLERVESELHRGGRHQLPLTVVMTDIDKFKTINDTYGHAAGDRVIQHFSNIFKKSLRAEDIIGRIGGEEFAIVLPHTDAIKGLLTIERIRETVEKTPCAYNPEDLTRGSLNYTASFGLVTVTEGEPTVVDLLRYADRALYEAKNSGRNRVVVGRIDDDDDKAPEPNDSLLRRDMRQ